MSLVIETEVKDLKIESFPNKEFCKVIIRNPNRISGELNTNIIDSGVIENNFGYPESLSLVKTIINNYGFTLDEVFNYDEIDDYYKREY